MCVLSITRLLRGVGRWARKPVNHTSWVAVVTLTDRPKSVRSRCLIELLCDVVCVVALPFWHFCWCRGFCHRTGSDLLLFVFFLKTKKMFNVWLWPSTLKNNDVILMQKGAYVPPIMTIIAKAVQPVWYLQWIKPEFHMLLWPLTPDLNKLEVSCTKIK